MMYGFLLPRTCSFYYLLISTSLFFSLLFFRKEKVKYLKKTTFIM